MQFYPFHSCTTQFSLSITLQPALFLLTKLCSFLHLSHVPPSHLSLPLFGFPYLPPGKHTLCQLFPPSCSLWSHRGKLLSCILFLFTTYFSSGLFLSSSATVPLSFLPLFPSFSFFPQKEMLRSLFLPDFICLNDVPFTILSLHDRWSNLLLTERTPSRNCELFGVESF